MAQERKKRRSKELIPITNKIAKNVELIKSHNRTMQPLREKTKKNLMNNSLFHNETNFYSDNNADRLLNWRQED